MMKYVNLSWVYLGVIGLCLCLCVPGTFGQDLPRKKVNRATLKILKSENASFYVDERKYIVDGNTDIRDRFNRRIKLHLMWVPCLADVTFVTVNGVESLCLKIKVKKELRKDMDNVELYGR